MTCQEAEMSFVVAVPEALSTAAAELNNLGAALGTANATGAVQTTAVLAAAEDEVSTAIAAIFSAHGEGFQVASAQASAFHDQFTQALFAGRSLYAGAEAANANPLQALEQQVLAV